MNFIGEAEVPDSAWEFHFNMTVVTGTSEETQQLRDPGLLGSWEGAVFAWELGMVARMLAFLGEISLTVELG